MDISKLLAEFGLSDKEISVYLSLLASGPSSVRKLADKSGINRGTTYDILKALKDLGLVSYYHKSTKQYFMAEDPARLLDALDEKAGQLKEVKNKLTQAMPEFKALSNQAGVKPIVRFYESYTGIRQILTDVLDSVKNNKDKKYYVFSSASVRPYLYKALPDFTAKRIKEKLEVWAIAVGSGGEETDFSRRKWLSKKSGSPTYTLIYADKVAMISVDQSKNPLGLIIEDRAIFETQKQLFEYVWESLE